MEDEGCTTDDGHREHDCDPETRTEFVITPTSGKP